MKNLRRCNCCVVFVGEKKNSTSLQLLRHFSLWNLLIHICDYFLELQIPLQQVLSCFAPTFIEGKKIKRSPAVCSAVYGPVLRFLHWKGTLEGTSTRFVRWKGTLKRTLSHCLEHCATLEDTIMCYHRDIQEGTFAAFLWTHLSPPVKQYSIVKQLAQIVV